MRRSVVFAPRTRRWLGAEIEYLEEHAPSVISRLYERLTTAVQILSEYPQSGIAVAGTDRRRLVVPPYVFTYREVGADLIEIIDIRHSRQAERPILQSQE